MCVLREPPHLVEYTRPSSSGSRPSCSGVVSGLIVGLRFWSDPALAPGRGAGSAPGPVGAYQPTAPGQCRICPWGLSRPGERRSRWVRLSGLVVRGGGVTPTAVFLNESGLLEMLERVRHLAWGQACGLDDLLARARPVLKTGPDGGRVGGQGRDLWGNSELLDAGSRSAPSEVRT